MGIPLPHALDSLPLGYPPFSKCQPTFLPCGAGWLGPFQSGTPLALSWPGYLSVLEEINIYRSLSVGVHLGTFWSGLHFPMAWSYLEAFLPSKGSGPSVAGGVSTATAVLKASGVLTAGAATHPFHSFLEDCSCCKGSLLGIPCKCHHLLIGPLVGVGKGHVRDQAWGYQPATLIRCFSCCEGCHLSLRCCFMESRISLWSHSSNASSHLLCPGSLHSW